MENRSRAQVRELLQIEVGAVDWLYRSYDLRGDAEAQGRLRQLLDARPRILHPAIVWSEAPSFHRGSLVASIESKGGRLRLELAGYQVRIVEPSGRAWSFRNVAIDLWP